MGVRCAWYARAKGTSCDAEASFYHNFMLCSEHQLTLAKKLGGTARQSAEYHTLASFPGWCYVVLLRNGYIKIGYSNTDGLLVQRLTNLDPVMVIDQLRGGFVTEAVLHHEMAEYRVPGKGELFDCSVNEARRRIEKVVLTAGLGGDRESCPAVTDEIDSPLPDEGTASDELLKSIFLELFAVTGVSNADLRTTVMERGMAQSTFYRARAQLLRSGWLVNTSDSSLAFFELGRRVAA